MSDFLKLHGVDLTFEELHISIMGFPCGSTGEGSTCSVGDLGSIPGLGRSAGERTATHSSILAWRIPWTI